MITIRHLQINQLLGLTDPYGVDMLLKNKPTQTDR